MVRREEEIVQWCQQCGDEHKCATFGVPEGRKKLARGEVSFFREISIPVTAISKVTESCLIRPPTITIHLDHQTTLGRWMVFVPAGRAHYFSEHPTTTELKEILARTHQVHQADRVHALHELTDFFNVVGHSGYEYHRRWFMDSWVKYISNTPTNHIMHHEKMRGNYGLYFSFWDHVMRTNHADYETRLREVTSRLPEPREKTANSVAPQHS